MAEVLLLAGILCLLSFVILCIRQVDFCIIWLLLALLWGIWGGYLYYRKRNPAGYHLPGFFVIVFLILFFGVLTSFLIVEGNIVAGMYQKMEQTPEYVIVLGAQVKKTEPSKALRLRIKRAESFLKENPKTIAILSGGQGDGEEISEAACMYQCLLEAGIEDDRLLLEDASTTTKENLQYSKTLIDRDLKIRGRGLEKAKDLQIALISNNFHLYRAIRMAKKQGYIKVWGIAAPGDLKLQIHYMVREYFAIIQALIKGDI